MSAETTEVLQSQMTGRLAGRIAARAHVPKESWPAKVASWLALVDLCLELENTLNFAEIEPADMLALHKAVLQLAIGTGEWLLQQIKANEIDVAKFGVEMENLDASLEILVSCLKSRHAGTPRAEIEKLQQRVFGVAA